MTLVILPKATKHNECGEAFPEVPHRTCLSGPHPKQLGRSEQSISQWRPKYRWADVSEGKWSGVTGRKKRKRREDKREGKWGSEGDRQRLGPTYNREHERAQNVPQWSPRDGRERWHHALEPRQPTLTITTAIHTHTHGSVSSNTLHLTNTVALKTQTAVASQWMWLNVMKLKFIPLSPSCCEFEYQCVMILNPNTWLFTAYILK